jgi:hypothetical protein
VCEVYRLGVTVYELKDRDRYSGEFYVGEGESEELVMSAHMDLERGAFVADSRHDEILRGIRLLCVEIAGNIEEPLF